MAGRHCRYKGFHHESDALYLGQFNKLKTKIMDETLVKLVKEEAKKLREHATKEEINKLDLIYLDPQSSSHCIYGQMTGECVSKRAKELIDLCNTQVYHNHESHYMRRKYDDLKDIITNIHADERLKFYMTPIEVFIMDCGTYNHSILMNYLRKETDILEFDLN